MVKFETVRKFALSLPETTEKLSFGTPAFFAKGKLFVQLRDDHKTLALKASELDRRALSALEPDVFSVPKHFESWPGMVVQLATVERKMLEGLLIEAWRMMAPNKLRDAFDAAYKTVPPQKTKKSSTEKK